MPMDPAALCNPFTSSQQATRQQTSHGTDLFREALRTTDRGAKRVFVYMSSYLCLFWTQHSISKLPGGVIAKLSRMLSMLKVTND